MQLFQIDVPESYELILWGDNQEGNIAQSREGVKSCIDYILSAPNRYCVHMGDALEAFWIEDPRYQQDTCQAPPLEQMRTFMKTVEPLAKEGRLWSILLGNHELRFVNKAGNITKFMCEELQKVSGNKFPLYGTYAAKLELQDSKGLQWKQYVTHGRKSINSVSPDPGRKRAYMEFILQRHLENKFGDCLVMAKGHAHKLLVKRPTPTLYLTSAKGKILQHYTKAGSGTTKDFYIPPENRWYACYDKETEILTENGYKLFAELKEDEKVVALNPETSHLCLIAPIKIIKQPYQGEMIHFQSTQTDIMVTPDHQMFLVSRRGKTEFLAARNVGVKGEKLITKRSNGFKENRESLCSTFNVGKKQYDINLFLKFLGWYLSEGCIPRLTGKNRTHKYEILISQSLAVNPTKYAEIRILCAMLFDRIGCVKNGVYVKGEDGLAEYLLSLGVGSHNKRVPPSVKNLPPHLLKIILDSFCAGDGTIAKKTGERYFYSSSPGLADDIYEMIVKSGLSASIHLYKPQKSGWSPMYRVSELYGKRQTILPKYTKRVSYDDFVYCVELPKYHVINVRRNRKNAFCGNCTASFLKSMELGVSTYSEIAEYDPTELGFIKVITGDRDVQDVVEVKV